MNDKKYPTADELTPLMNAAWEGDKDKVLDCLKNSSEINEADIDGDTALIWAVKGNHLDIVKLLHKSGANINARNWAQLTALGVADEKGYDDIAKFLRSHDAHE